MRNKSLIREDDRIRQLLIKRFEELSLSQKAIIEDSESLGYDKLSASNLNRYLKNNEKGIGRNTLTEAQILWLCERYCINVQVIVAPGNYTFKKAKNGKEVKKK